MKVRLFWSFLSLCLLGALGTPLMAKSVAIKAAPGAELGVKKEKKSAFNRMKSSLKKKSKGVKSDKQLQKYLAKSQKYKEKEAHKAEQKMESLEAHKVKTKKQSDKMAKASEALK